MMEQQFLYARGMLYAYAAIMTFLSSLPIAPHANGRMSRAHKWQKRVLSFYFLCLAAGGISALGGQPAIGQWLITYGATVLILAYDLWISFFVILRK